MKIAYVHANFWPYVRRGVERFVYELASYMTHHGHTVDVITTKPGPDRIDWYEDIRVIYQRQRRHPLAQGWRFGFLYIYLFGLTVSRQLQAEEYDIIHCWFYTYAPAAHRAARRHGGRYIYHNILNPPHFDHPIDRAWFRWALRRAAAVAVLSQEAAQQLDQEHGITPVILPPPVDLQKFHIAPEKDLSRPRILFASSLTDPKKGLELLIRAFNYVHRRYPEAILQLAGPEEWHRMPDWLWELLDPPELQASIEILGTGTLTTLSDLYAEAAVTVLPSLREPFGMVLIESLASGTPVVGTASGGPAEIIVPEVGTLIELDSVEEMSEETKARELAQAIQRSIELGRDPATAQRCRARAQAWDIKTIGARTEALYQEVL